MSTQTIGQRGEKMAADYLINKGYELLECNYYTHCGEIDLIVWDKIKNELVFVEVKTRRTKKFGYPEEAIDSHKLKRMMDSSEKYLVEAGYHGNYRFDCVAIELDPLKQIVHLKNIS